MAARSGVLHLLMEAKRHAAGRPLSCKHCRFCCLQCCQQLTCANSSKHSFPSTVSNKHPTPRSCSVCVTFHREDTAWVYDPKTSSLLMFGGWASRWLGDLVKLNISAIIGPPYACTGKHATAAYKLHAQPLNMCSTRPCHNWSVGWLLLHRDVCICHKLNSTSSTAPSPG